MATTVKRPWWQQATALVTVTAGGAVTALNFAPGTAAELSAPTALPVHLDALEKSAQQADASSDTALRSAIVNVAKHYLRVAQDKTPAQMEALIWGADSTNGADHGPSCAAFASLTLELAAQAVGQQSWVSGGTTYPWPLHEWADVRVDPNPDSLGITSILQDAQAHDRWHPLGDGYTPQPGDWVLFDGHVEVVTAYTGGVLYTIGGDSLPNFSVNAHTYGGSLAGDGVAGFVDNGNLVSATDPSAHPATHPTTHPAASSDSGRTSTTTTAGGTAAAAAPGASTSSANTSSTAKGSGGTAATASPGGTAAAASPGGTTGVVSGGAAPSARSSDVGSGKSEIPGAGSATTATSSGGGSAKSGIPSAATGASRGSGESSIPGAAVAASAPTAPAEHTSYARNKTSPASAATTSSQAAFISEVAPGAIATQREYGIPAAVTIAQAIDESGWGQSELAVEAHNLFGIKGTGPAGSVTMPTSEYEDGTWVTIQASFRAYHDFSESIEDHGRLLATDSAYSHAMADRKLPDAFAADLAGVYATDPSYGGELISLMRLYDLYRFDTPSSTPTVRTTHTAPSSSGGSASVPGAVAAAGTVTVSAAPAAPAAKSAPTSGKSASIPGLTATVTAARYPTRIPLAVADAYVSTAKVPLARAEPLYRDVAAVCGIPWQLLAACDWLQCASRPNHSPVQGEKLGKVNPDGSVYRTKSQALAQCAADLIGMSAAVYGIDLRVARRLSVTELAKAFAAFRWGELLRRHGVSAMEFPYSVAGLTEQHMKMSWPRIDEPAAPDKPGSRYRAAFGAIPIIMRLDYPATV
jgi:flagellum-specific peptidoglycan hydrolase FlgJ